MFKKLVRAVDPRRFVRRVKRIVKVNQPKNLWKGVIGSVKKVTGPISLGHHVNRLFSGTMKKLGNGLRSLLSALLPKGLGKRLVVLLLLGGLAWVGVQVYANRSKGDGS